MEWDELMYHLPYARFWADQGELAINEWLRYPLFAYNMDLLYGATLVVGDDVLTHLIHALTAALSAVMVFAVAREYLDWRVGLIAVILLIRSTQWGWSNAYVDLGVMLSWTSAFATLALRSHIQDSWLSYLAAFFAGIAVGVKYQGLFYLPIFFLLALIIEKRLSILIRAGTIFVIIGGFWYLRSYIISGDPVHPVGGHLFGFWLWNADDLRGQHSDLDHVRGWRDWSFLPALAAPLFWPTLKPFLRGLLVVTALSVALWFLVSGYWRYLSPIYPLLALLSAWVIIKIWDSTGIGPIFEKLLAKQQPKAATVFYVVMVVAALLFNSKNIIRAWNDIYPDPETRDLYLAERFPGHAMMKVSPGIPTDAILYHLGFEGEIYLLGKNIIGDWFGPGRYSDVLARWDDANSLSQHLKSMGVDYFLINLHRKPFSSLVFASDFLRYFDFVNRSDKAALYQLRP